MPHNVSQAAERLGVSRSTIYRLVKRGELFGKKEGKQWRIAFVDEAPKPDSPPCAEVKPSTSSGQREMPLRPRKSFAFFVNYIPF